MTKLTLDEFKNFFKYYKGEPHQQHAVGLLYDHLDRALFDNQLYTDSEWVETYRQSAPATIEDMWEEEKTPAAPAKKWPVTKEQLGEIMLCSPDSLPDSLMDDFAECVDLYDLNEINIAYFLGQCGHESAGLRYPVEIHDGSDYEFRRDLGNVYPGDGVKFAGTGWIQVTGRYNHSRFSEYLDKKNKHDSGILNIGKTYTSEKYPWSISGFWWYDNNMVDYCNTMPDVDEVGARVNGRYLPNGYQDRRDYTRRAFSVLGIS